MSADRQERRPATKQALVITASVLAGVVVLFVLWRLAEMLLVIFAGVLLGVLLDALCNWLGRHLHLPRKHALPLVVIILLLLLTVATAVVGPRIADEFTRLSDKIPQALQNLQNSVANTEWGKRLLTDTPSPKELLPIGSDLLERITGVFSTALGAIAGALIVLFVGIYLAASPNEYARNVVRLLPKDKRQRAEEVLLAAAEALRWWLVGRFAAMIVIGILVAAGLAIVGVPLALTLGLIAAILSFIPFIGPVLSAIPMVLVALAEDPVLVIWALGVYLVVQILEGYVITPMIQKQAVFIPPALLITIQILMSVLFGIVGMLLATPLAVVAIVMIQMLYVEDVLKDKVRIMGRH